MDTPTDNIPDENRVLWSIAKNEQEIYDIVDVTLPVGVRLVFPVAVLMSNHRVVTILDRNEVQKMNEAVEQHGTN